MTVSAPKTVLRPSSPNFSSGPCAKRSGWSVDHLKDAALGRSHRSKIGKSKLGEVLNRSRKLLGLPGGYCVGIVLASDTSAVERAHDYVQAAIRNAPGFGWGNGPLGQGTR